MYCPRSPASDAQRFCTPKEVESGRKCDQHAMHMARAWPGETFGEAPWTKKTLATCRDIAGLSHRPDPPKHV